MMTSSLQTTFTETLAQAARKFSLISHHFQEVSDLLSALSTNMGPNEPLFRMDSVVGHSIQNAISACQANDDQTAFAIPPQMAISGANEEKENLPELVNTVSKASKKPRKKPSSKPMDERASSIVENVIQTQPLAPIATVEESIPVVLSQPLAPIATVATVEESIPVVPSQLPVPEPQHQVTTPVDPLSNSAPVNSKKKVINVFNYYCNEFKDLVKTENPMLSKTDVYKKLVEQWKQYPDKAAYTKKVMESHQETPSVDELANENATEPAKTATKKKRSRKHSAHTTTTPPPPPTAATTSPTSLTATSIAMKNASSEPVNANDTTSMPVSMTPAPIPAQLVTPMTGEKSIQPVSTNGLIKVTNMDNTVSSIMDPILTESGPPTTGNTVTVTEKAKKPSSKKRKKSLAPSIESSIVATMTTGEPTLAHPVETPMMSQSQPVASVHHHVVMPASPIMSQSQPIVKVSNKPNPNSKILTPPTTAAPSPAPQKIMTPAMREIQEEAALSSLEREREKKKKKDSHVHHVNMSKH